MADEDLSTDELYGRLLALATPSVVRRTLHAFLAERTPLLKRAQRALVGAFASAGAGASAAAGGGGGLSPADLKAGGVTIAFITSPVGDGGCGLTLRQLVDERVVSPTDEGLVVLVRDLGLTLDMVLPALQGLRGQFALPALAELFGGNEAVVNGLLAGGFEVKVTQLLAEPWLSRLRPADWAVLGGAGSILRSHRRLTTMVQPDKGAALKRMLAAAKPRDWARVAGLGPEHVLSLEWGLGTTPAAAAEKLGWDRVETEHAFALKKSSRLPSVLEEEDVIRQLQSKH